MSITISTDSNDYEFSRKIEEISGEPYRKCMQCGTCSGVCPVDGVTDITPRRLIHLAMLGLKDAAMSYNMSRMCASCHACQIRCPRGLEVPRIVEAVRQVQLRANKDMVDIPKISRETLKDASQIAMVSSFRKHTA